MEEDRINPLLPTPSWNLTMECREWTEDYNPCTFPYHGLDRFSLNNRHCYLLFSEAFPDAYQFVHIFFLVSYSSLLLLYGRRIVFFLVDTNCMPVAWIAKTLYNDQFARSRKPNIDKLGSTKVAVNVYDYCNVFMFLTSLLQVVLSTDVEGWSDQIPYKVHVTIGIISQAIAVMTGIPITVNWMNLIHVWSNPFKNRNTRPPLGKTIRNLALGTIWLVSFPITFSALFFTKHCDNGCENGSISCLGKFVFSIVLVAIVTVSSFYAYSVYLALRSENDFHWLECPQLPTCLRRKTAEDEIKLSKGSALSDQVVLSGSHSSSDQPATHSLSDSPDKETERIVWLQIQKIWKIVFFSVFVSSAVIYDNLAYCFSHFGEIKFESPPCSASETVLNVKSMWFILIGVVVMLVLIPYRQKRQSESTTRALVKRIGSRTKAPSSSNSAL